jgi:hypothetical protein
MKTHSLYETKDTIMELVGRAIDEAYERGRISGEKNALCVAEQVLSWLTPLSKRTGRPMGPPRFVELRAMASRRIDAVRARIEREEKRD